MNYFKFHIGDYSKKTPSLTLAEHGAYVLMLMSYYATELPLPTGSRLYRLLHVSTQFEKRAVDNVVKQFWKLTDRGLVNIRADQEIIKDQEFLASQRAKAVAGAAARWKKADAPGDATGHTNGHATGHKFVNGSGHANGHVSGIAPLMPPTPDPVPVKNKTPLPPLEKGAKARKRRSPERTARDQAGQKWDELIGSSGKNRDVLVQRAIDAIGGWPRIANRTDRDTHFVKKAFCQAYVDAASQH